MAMNKVVHAAQRAAFSVAIDATINAVRGKGPENMAEQAVKLVNLAQPLLAKRYPDANWDAVRAFVSDPNSKWMQYAVKKLGHCGLAAAVMPQKRYKFARLYGQIDPMQHFSAVHGFRII